MEVSFDFFFTTETDSLCRQIQFKSNEMCIEIDKNKEKNTKLKQGVRRSKLKAPQSTHIEFICEGKKPQKFQLIFNIFPLLFLISFSSKDIFLLFSMSL
jgi:hypothetical protein